MNRKVLITGATGMVGCLVLQYLLEETSVEQVISIGRRKTGLKHNKLKEIEHDNFLDFKALSSDLTNIDSCFHCLGVYQNQVSKEKFWEITCGFQKALTDTLEQSSPNLTFVLFGASGADPSEKSKILFAKAKGHAENLLNKTSFPKKYIFRPGYIHPTGNKKPKGIAYAIMLPIGAALFKLFPAVGISDKNLAKAMVIIGLKRDRQSKTFSNAEIKKIC